METTQALLGFLDSLVGETLGEDLGLSLLNNAKDLIEADRDWYFLMKEDSTKTRTPSDTFLTAKDLPTDILRPYKVILGDSATQDYAEIMEIPFAQRRQYSDIPRFYIDWANNKISICGTYNKTYTIYLNYIYQTPDLDTSSSNLVWPSKFHKLIAFLAAELYQSGIDTDDITARQAIAQNKQASILFNSLVNLDAQIKVKQMNYNTAIEGEVNNGGININE